MNHASYLEGARRSFLQHKTEELSEAFAICVCFLRNRSSDGRKSGYEKTLADAVDRQGDAMASGRFADAFASVAPSCSSLA